MSLDAAASQAKLELFKAELRKILRTVPVHAILEEVRQQAPAEVPLPSVPVSAIPMRQVEACFKIRYTGDDRELYEVARHDVPDELENELQQIRRWHQRLQGNESTVRFTVNALILHALDIAADEDQGSIDLLNLQTEPTWTSEPYKYDKQTCKITGRPDYCVWYGEEEDVALNVVIVEAKTPGMASAGECQALSYMGIVHNHRKALNKVNCTVYGVACDATQFQFLKLDNHSRWSKRVVFCPSFQYDEILGLLVYFMRQALAMSPRNSAAASATYQADPSQQDHPRQASKTSYHQHSPVHVSMDEGNES